MNMRDALEADIPRLAEIKPPRALHADRIQDARQGDFRYLVYQTDSNKIIGFTCLVFRYPRTWPKNPEHYMWPRIIDLHIAENIRNKGFGIRFMNEIEAACKEANYSNLYLSVDPEHNNRAHNFYLKLGYTDIQDEPYWGQWSFKDSAGNVHQGQGLNIDMVKHFT